MHPTAFRYCCPKCGVSLVEERNELQENLDGGPYGLLLLHSCRGCARRFETFWLLVLRPTPSGVASEPRLIHSYPIDAAGAALGEEAGPLIQSD